MLQKLRENSKSTVAGIFIGILLLVFALSGSEALFMGGADSQERVAQVNGEDINRVDLQRAIRTQRQQLQERFGDNMPPGAFSDENLREPVLNDLIQREVMAQAARQSGMTVGDQTVNQVILNTPQFAQDGRFNENAYRQMVRALGYTPSTYRRALTNDMILNQLNHGLQETNFVTDAELERFYKLSRQRRDFRYVVIPADAVADRVEVSREEIRSYYEANPERFTAPERVAVDYIELSVSDLLEDVEVPEDVVRRQFEQNLSSFEERTEWSVAHILLDEEDPEVLDEIYQRLDEGESFADLAREYSVDAGSRNFGGELGITTGDTFPDAFEQAVQSLGEGEVSEPVSTSDGVHVIKVLGIEEAQPPRFEDERDRLEQQLRRAEAETLYIDLMESLSEQSYNADDLANVADNLNLPLDNTGLFSREGDSGMAAQPAVIEAAFSEEVLEHRNSSDLLELSQDRSVVIKLTEHRPEQLRDLEQVRDDIVATLREEKARDMLAERGRALREQARNGDLAELAEREELTLVDGEGVERGDPEYDRRLLEEIFSLPRPGDEPVLEGIHTSAGDYALVELTDVHSPDMDELDGEERRALRGQLARLFARDEFTGVRQLLREQASIDR